MRRKDQYILSFKFILNIYICYIIKKIKSSLNFFALGGSGQTITFFNCVTYKTCHEYNS
jgi:hypothetical protein